MENVVLTVHLILALLLIGVVLLQRSEGGGLGLGGGGGNVMTGRQAANAMSRATWILATGFLITSITLTVIAARGAGSGSVMDRISPTPAAPASNLPTLPTYVPPPGVGQPVLPPTAGGTAAPETVPATAPAPTAPPTTEPVVAPPAAPVTPPVAPAAPATPPAAEAPAAPAAPAPTTAPSN